MKIGFIFCFLITSIDGFSQEKTVNGIVFDTDSKLRIASVNIHNITQGISQFNNLKGEYKIPAKAGDILVFTRQQYHPDTLKISDNGSQAVYMSRLAIQLKLVTVHDSLLTPEQRLANTKRDYTKIYGSLGYKDFLSTSSGGAGLSIDALYNAFSRSGRNASRLQEIIQRDYQQNVIDFRFNSNLVARITGLKGDKLNSFMYRYRPGYYTITTASDYEFISMIKLNLRRYLRNPRTYTLPPLKSKT